MSEELAIIKDVSFGVRDINQANLSFSVHTKDYGVLQVLGALEAIELIEKHQIRNIEHLEGKPCIVDVDHRAGTIVFKDLKKI
jgi:hypothetical protein